MAQTIITIGRQFGSGGREIGELLAKELGIKFYDKELLKRAAKESGFSEDVFETHDEKPTNSFLYSLVMNTYSMGYTPNNYLDMPIDHNLFLAQIDAIKKIADEGACVIVGRCSDYALEQYEHVVNIFICADLENRTERIMRLYDLSESKAKDLIIKTDKKRANYYNYYTNKEWGAAKNYDLCINSSLLGIEGTVKALKEILVKFFPASL